MVLLFVSECNISCFFQYPAGEGWRVVQILWGWGYVPLLGIFGGDIRL